MTTTSDIIDDIRFLPHYRDISCPKCREEFRVHTLRIYAHCPQCGEKRKFRGFGAKGTEIEDVVDAVLEWMGTGETLKAVMHRHDEIVSDLD